jgi:hypothetical protein
MRQEMDEDCDRLSFEFDIRAPAPLFVSTLIED